LWTSRTGSAVLIDAWKWAAFQSSGSPQQIQDPKFKIQDSKFKIQNSRFKIQDSRFKIQDSKFKIQNSKFKIQNSRSKIQDSRFKRTASQHITHQCRTEDAQGMDDCRK